MAKKGSDTDKKIIKAAIDLAHKKGLSGFSVRELCSKAKVNSGMFNYYFKKKEYLNECVLKTIYAGMIKNIELNVSPSKTPKENTTEILHALSIFLHDNRTIISAFAGDVLSLNITDKKIFGNFTTHIRLLSEELSKAKRQKMLATDSITNAIILMITPLIIPQMVLGYLERAGHPKSIQMFNLNSNEFDATVNERIKIAVNAVFKERIK